MTRRAHSMPFGAEITEKGVRFSIWAPTARDITLVVDGVVHDLPEAGGGWRQTVVEKARAGSRYGFRVGSDLVVPDPASRFQPDDVHGLSLVVDPSVYAWQDESWSGRPWEEAVIYELHVGTATPEGTYAALGDKLEELRDLGVTAVELMPIADFPGRRNWGYDGVLPFAPDAAYGTPDDLKRLVDRAHGLGMMMFLDVVYNHFGPAGNYLHAYAGSFFTERHKTPWGAGINFDGREGAAVRDYFTHNALYWLEEFHFDGLRFDAVHAILDDSDAHMIAEIAERIHAALPGREPHLVLENGKNESRWLERANGRPRLHTAQWDDDTHHCWHVLLTGEHDGYYRDYARDPVALLGRCLAEGFAYQGEPSPHEGRERGEPSGHLPPTAFVSFIQNHDQIGNRALGERLHHLAPPEKLALARAGLLLSPHIPLLFMGEEWAASTPFQYFVDFADDPALSAAVRDGRREEFGSFASFSADAVPDPTLEETASRSRIDWAERASSPHREILDETRQLLALRREEILPLIRSPFVSANYARPSERQLDVRWAFEAGTLRFLANFGNEDAVLDATPGERVIWKSLDAGHDGTTATLPSWTGLFTKGGA